MSLLFPHFACLYKLICYPFLLYRLQTQQQRHEEHFWIYSDILYLQGRAFLKRQEPTLTMSITLWAQQSRGIPKRREQNDIFVTSFNATSQLVPALNQMRNGVPSCLDTTGSLSLSQSRQLWYRNLHSGFLPL